MQRRNEREKSQEGRGGIFPEGETGRERRFVFRYSYIVEKSEGAGTWGGKTRARSEELLLLEKRRQEIV